MRPSRRVRRDACARFAVRIPRFVHRELEEQAKKLGWDARDVAEVVLTEWARGLEELPPDQEGAP